jgi:hypothetical protein
MPPRQIVLPPPGCFVKKDTYRPWRLFGNFTRMSPVYGQHRGLGMSIRCGIRAIGGAMTAVRLDTWNPDTRNPGAALLLTLLLTSP